jgi:hypothetical protein
MSNSGGGGREAHERTAEGRLGTEESNPYVKENTALHHCKGKVVDAV